MNSRAGAPFAGSNGVLIAKKPNQSGINAVQIEFFTPDEAGLAEMMDGVSRGYLMQVRLHSHVCAWVRPYACAWYGVCVIWCVRACQPVGDQTAPLLRCSPHPTSRLHDYAVLHDVMACVVHKAHAGVNDDASIKGCNNLPRMTTLVAAFLIAASND